MLLLDSVCLFGSRGLKLLEPVNDADRVLARETAGGGLLSVARTLLYQMQRVSL